MERVRELLRALAAPEILMEKTYQLSGDDSITCLLCGTSSQNPNDVLYRYCARCHRFHDDPPWMARQIVKREPEEDGVGETCTLECGHQIVSVVPWRFNSMPCSQCLMDELAKPQRTP